MCKPSFVYLKGIGQFARDMISTQLDLFGGPPKPPKNIREEEPPVVPQPAVEISVDPDNEPEPGSTELASEGTLSDVGNEHPGNDLPAWIDEPAPEPDIDIEEGQGYESYPDTNDARLEDYGSVAEVVTEPEDVPDEDAMAFAETIPKEGQIELEVEPDVSEEYVNENSLEVLDEQENETEAEATVTRAEPPQDTVHVQFPGHASSPVNFTSLIPVESFVVEDEYLPEEDEMEPQDRDSVEADGNEIFDLDDKAVEEEMLDEEPPSSPFMAEAITKDDVIIGGGAVDDLEAAMNENPQEIKEGQLQIPEDEKLFLRQYYTMRETSNMFGVNQSLLRYWENEFDVLKPKKNRKGDRYFRPEDIKNLELIYHLLKVRKFTIEGAREYIKSKKKVLDTFELVQRLEKLKFFLHELKTHL